MKLPNGENAIVSPDRLTGYLLDPHHPEGRHKARVFASALGTDASSADVLRTWLLQLAHTGDAEAGLADQYGQRFMIRGRMHIRDERLGYGPAGYFELDTIHRNS